jgi:hypothetical protein
MYSIMKRLNTIRTSYGTQDLTTNMYGSGIVDFIKHPIDWITNKTLIGRPKVLNDLLTKEGNSIIRNISICRIPVQSTIQKLMNVLTFGAFKKKIKKSGYDTVYHLFIVLTLANGSVYSIEKNQRVNVIKGPKLGTCQDMQYGRKTLNQFITTAEEKNQYEGFYRYSAFKFNCQHFIHAILNANGISKFNSFVLQDVADLAPGLFKKFANVVTDVAGVSDYVVRGGAYD